VADRCSDSFIAHFLLDEGLHLAKKLDGVFSRGCSILRIGGENVAPPPKITVSLGNFDLESLFSGASLHASAHSLY
jgi:hypothetical protein